MEKKNILVLTGSPRKNGNSDKMAEAFIKGATAAGHEVTKFETARKDILGCKACNTCWSKGTACSFEDDFQELTTLLEAADAIVFATPLYWFSFSAQIKAAIDKMYSYLGKDCKKPLKIKESALLVCGGDDEPEVFEGITISYKAIAKYMKWQDRGVVIVPGVSEKNDIEGTKFLEEIEKLGKSI